MAHRARRRCCWWCCRLPRYSSRGSWPPPASAVTWPHQSFAWASACFAAAKMVSSYAPINAPQFNPTSAFAEKYRSPRLRPQHPHLSSTLEKLVMTSGCSSSGAATGRRERSRLRDLGHERRCHTIHRRHRLDCLKRSGLDGRGLAGMRYRARAKHLEANTRQDTCQLPRLTQKITNY